MVPLSKKKKVEHNHHLNVMRYMSQYHDERESELNRVRILDQDFANHSFLSELL